MSRKLQYFDINGFAEAIRYILHYGELEFEDIRYKYSMWPVENVKDSLPYGQMPLYEENGRVLNQSLAIARYVASQVGLLPSDPSEQAQLDAAALTIYDFLFKLKSIFVEKDPKKKEENKKSEYETIEYFMPRFEKELKAGNGHFGGKLNYADFILVSAIEMINLFLQDSIEKDYLTIKSLVTEIYSLPGVKKYLAKRTPYQISI